MDLIKCEAFLTAAETGSLTAAAAQMGYSQSGMTRMIESLEDEVGFSLFVRSKRGVELTENGRGLMPFFREMIRSYNSAEQYSADIRGTIRGSVTIGSYYSISAILMPSILSDFREMYPGVSVRIHEGSNLEMAQWLKEQSVDLCFCAEPHIPGIDWIPLIKDEIVVWVSENHPMAKAGAFPVKQLEKEQFIHTSPGRDTELDRLIADQKLSLKPYFTTKDGFTTYNMVEAGLGVSFNQKLISTRWHGRVAELPFEPRQYIDLGIAIPSSVGISPAASRFIDCIKDSVRAERELRGSASDNQLSKVLSTETL